MTRLAVFASGRGTNLARILTACAGGELPARVVLVVCNQPGAGAVAIAREAGIPLALLDHRDFPDRVAHERAIADELRRHDVELLALAGYMRLLSPFLLGFTYDPELGQSRVLNIHPADPIRYRGTDGYAWAIATRQPATVVTVHFVDEGMDMGEVILQEPLPIRPDDTVASLTARGLALEHRIYPLAIGRVIARIGGTKPCAVS